MTMPSFRIRTLMVVIALIAGITWFVREDQDAHRDFLRKRSMASRASLGTTWGCGGSVRQKGDRLDVSCRLNVYETEPGALARWSVRFTDQSTGKVVYDRTTDGEIPIPTNRRLRDTYTYVISPALPPGTYQFRIGLIGGRKNAGSTDRGWRERGSWSSSISIQPSR